MSVGFGAFAGGAAGGMSMGKSIKNAQAAKIPGGSEAEASAEDNPVGFGLGQPLVSGAAGSASIAGESSQPWGALSAIVTGAGQPGAQAQMYENSAVGRMGGPEKMLESSVVGKLGGPEGMLGKSIIGKFFK